MTVSGPIALGAGGITVVGAANSGSFSIRLSGNNSYTGETRVINGTLMLTGDSRISDVSTVRVESGAVLHLDFTGTDTVGTLFLGTEPNPKPNGTYGSLTSTAANKSAAFLGNGILQMGASNNFASWASIQLPPITGGPNGDDDAVGIFARVTCVESGWSVSLQTVVRASRPELEFKRRDALATV